MAFWIWANWSSSGKHETASCKETEKSNSKNWKFFTEAYPPTRRPLNHSVQNIPTKYTHKIGKLTFEQIKPVETKGGPIMLRQQNNWDNIINAGNLLPQSMAVLLISVDGFKRIRGIHGGHLYKFLISMRAKWHFQFRGFIPLNTSCWKETRGSYFLHDWPIY